MKRQLQQTLCILTGVFALSASNIKAADKDIVDTAVAAGDFKILAKALQATGLDKALKGKGPFTVFAPTDKAFMRLPKGTLATLLKPENKAQLSSILTYHVVSGNVNGATAVSLKEAKTLNGEKLKIQFKNAGLYINKSRITATDINASNGVIHVIDNVLIPKNLKPTSSAVVGKDAVSEKILTDAIDVGVDLFNDDNEKACATIYKIAVMAVLEIKPNALDKRDLASIKKTLAAVNASKNQRANAWSLRRAMNAILAKLSK
ncbi:MAG: putative surface protein with fasciclin (FAS1) repeats [Cryomorphaceae bacterium]|jgi:uncharacterized surface protein with fasciclin (FAS1) repeats